MFKTILTSLLFLSFATSAFAAQPVKTTKHKMKRPPIQVAAADTSSATSPSSRSAGTSTQQFSRVGQVDQWSKYLMLGMNMGFEYSRIGLSGHVKAKSRSTGISEDVDLSSDPAGALGVSAMYARLGRGALGFSAGGTFIQKIENNTNSTGSLTRADSFTMIRPEGNILLGSDFGLFGGLGANMEYFTGSDVQKLVSPMGFGFQAQVGYVPVRNWSMDLAYYITVHKLGSDYKDALGTSYEVNDEDSYMGFTQWRLRVAYLF